ncbi:MAG: selenocysteine-specific translation elongation factor [Chloroflexota bacterium]|nr:selenocysteine-specific translation elongation factor [Chloroflexota bacterium]
MYVIGTAGHVDHGKSMLVQALTGINPDRLGEEREREMSIDLGFAWLTLPSGRETSIVDVPGHEDFIKNMLAGVGGIDVALLVVAADESVMPQTREHLAILDLLGVSQGLVALTKTDLVEDPEWLELVREEVRGALQGTALADVAIIPVSSVTKEGIPELLAALDRLLDNASPPRDIGKPRLSIDRAFTISGFGTIVTGTLLDGRLHVDDEVEIVPSGLFARVRGLQTHKVDIEEALPGTRVAVNLSGISAEALLRGQVLAYPGWLDSTTLLDAYLRLLPNAPWGLEHDDVAYFYSGAARVQCHVRLLDTDLLSPGEEGWVQFRLSEPVAVIRGDRYILRSPSPSLTLGGGQILLAQPDRRYRRFQPDRLAQFESLYEGEPQDVLFQLLRQETVCEVGELFRRSRLPKEMASTALAHLLADGRVLNLSAERSQAQSLSSESLLMARERWEDVLARLKGVLRGYHERFPLRLGMPREELKSRMHLEEAAFDGVLRRAVGEQAVVTAATTVRLLDHRVVLSSQQKREVEKALASFGENPFAPPSLNRIEENLGVELLQYLVDRGDVVKVSDSVAFQADAYAKMKERLVAYMREHESVTVAEVRDMFGSSRRYALGFLESMDRAGVTKRLGDVHILRK